MSQNKNQNLNPAVPAADTPQPSTKLTPEAIIEQIRAMRSQVDDVMPLDKAQRQQLKKRARRQPALVVEASISVISSSGTVAQAVGRAAEDVLKLQSDVARWAMVEAELQSFFEGIEGANLVRRERLAFIASQAYSFGSQLVRNPENVELLPQVKEMQRRKIAALRKKAQANPQSPSPSPVPAPAPPHTTSPTPQA
jgi:hypothetical protein